MSDSEHRAAALFHPIMAADPTGIVGVVRIAIAGGNQSYLVPQELRGRFFKFKHSNGGEMQFGFTRDAAGTVVMDQAAALGTGHVSAGWPLAPGVEIDGRIPLGNGTSPVYLNFRCVNPGGFLVGTPSEQAAP